MKYPGNLIGKLRATTLRQIVNLRAAKCISILARTQ